MSSIRQSITLFSGHLVRFPRIQLGSIIKNAINQSGVRTRRKLNLSTAEFFTFWHCLDSIETIQCIQLVHYSTTRIPNAHNMTAAFSLIGESRDVWWVIAFELNVPDSCELNSNWVARQHGYVSVLMISDDLNLMVNARINESRRSDLWNIVRIGIGDARIFLLRQCVNYERQ